MEFNSRTINRGSVDITRLGPQKDTKYGLLEDELSIEEINKHIENILALQKKEKIMHYRNGREAKNGDKLVQLNETGQVQAFGVLHSATPGNDYCNGYIAGIQAPNQYACICDCLHIDDVAELLKEKGLEKRPASK